MLGIIFLQKNSIPFWQNMPIPKNYKLGPGDEVIISLWGEGGVLQLRNY